MGHITVKLALFAAVVLSCTSAIAQQSRAALFGNVADSTGAAVAGAAVVLINTNTNLEFPATTNESGTFITYSSPIRVRATYTPAR